MNRLISFTLLLTLLLSGSCQRKKVNQEQNEPITMEWYEPDDSTPREQCPCCDYISLPERGNYLICPICFWEDDGLDLDQLDVSSGPNHGITLREGRANFAKFGACEQNMVQHVLSVDEREKFKREIRKTD